MLICYSAHVLYIIPLIRMSSATFCSNPHIKFSLLWSKIVPPFWVNYHLFWLKLFPTHAIYLYIVDWVAKLLACSHSLRNSLLVPKFLCAKPCHVHVHAHFNMWWCAAETHQDIKQYLRPNFAVCLIQYISIILKLTYLFLMIAPKIEILLFWHKFWSQNNYTQAPTLLPSF